MRFPFTRSTASGRPARRNNSRRSFSRLCRLGLEPLETRLLMAADAFEENDSFEAASILPAGDQTIPNLTIDATNDPNLTEEDFYRWTANTTGGVRVEIQFTNALGNLDLEIFDSFRNQLDTSFTPNNFERVEIDVVAGEQYFILVAPSFAAGGSPNYTLKITQIPLDSQDTPLLNNTMAEATNLGSSTPSFNNLSLHSPSDEDYFRFEAPSAGTFNVDVDFLNANGNVDLSILDAFGVEIARSAENTNGEQASVMLDAGEVVFVRIFSEMADAAPEYDLDFGFGQPPDLAPIGTQVIFAGQTLQLPLSVSDPDTPLSALQYSGMSNNPAFLPTGAISIDTSGPTPILRITSNAIGSAHVTVTVNDGEGGTDSETFLFTTLGGSPNVPPAISNIDNQTVNEDTASNLIQFTVNDAATPPGNLIVTATSSNQAIIPNGNISLGGSGSNRSIQVTPAAHAHGGPVTITVVVRDEGGLTAFDTFQVNVNPVADTPNLTVNPASGNEDTAIPLNIISSLVDADGSEYLSIRITGVPTGARLSAGVVDGSGAWFLAPSQLAGLTITPPPNDASPIPLTVRALATEASNASNADRIQALNVTVNPVNDAPTVSDVLSKSTPMNTATPAIPFTVGDIETAAGSLSVTATSSQQSIVANSGIVLGGSGANRTITITPQNGATGMTTITISVSDGAITTQEQFVLNVGGAANTAPTISDVGNSGTNEDTATSAIAVNINDAETPLNDLVLTASSSNQTLIPNGNIVLGGTGGSRTITVTPVANLSGTATITLTVDDGKGGQATDTFTLTVNAVNDAPTITPVGNVTINEDTQTGALVFVIGDVDSAAVLLQPATSDNQTLVPNANIELGGTGSVRYVIVRPVADQSGSATITLSATDLALTTTRTFMVNVTPVNDPPTVSSISGFTMNEGSTFGPIPFTVGDDLTPAGSLNVTVVSGNQSLFQNSNLVLGGSGANRTLTITSQPNQFGGPVPITITVSDGSLTTNTTFFVTVAAINTPPALNNDTVSLDEHSGVGTLAVDLNEASTGNDTDTDGDPLTYSILSGNTGGAFAIHPSTGHITVANSAAVDFETTPSFNLVVRASDGSLSSTAIITINLSNIVEGPIINDAPGVTVPENSPNGTNVFNVNDAVSGGDVDGNGMPLTYSIIAGNAAGAFAINPNTGQITVANGLLLNFETVTQPFALTVRATNGSQNDTAVITISLTNVNEAPVINDAPGVTLPENSPVGAPVFNVNDANSGGDVDIDGNALSFSITAGNAAGAFTINPASGVITVANSSLLNFETATQPFVLTIQASDGSLTDTAQVTITLTNVNEAPAINDAPGVTVVELSPNGTNVFNVNDAFTGGDTDQEGNAITYSITAGNAAGAFAINASTGQITVANGSLLVPQTPPLVFVLTVQGTDGTLADTGVITITLTDVNDPPVINNASASLAENSPNGTNVFNVNEATTGNDTDIDGNALTYSIIAGNGAGAFAINPSTGQITVANSSPLNFETVAQPFSLTVQASDGTLSDTAVITITLTNVNEAPLINDVPGLSLAENTANGTNVFNVNDATTGGDTDVDGNALTYSIVGGNGGGAFAINATTGQITVANSSLLDRETTPSYALTVQASDGSLTDTAVVTIALTNVNEAPTINDAPNVTLAENSANGSNVFNVNDAVTGNDTDLDGNALTYSITAGNAAGAFAINASTGQITVANSSLLNFETVAQPFALTIQASDGTFSDTAVVTITLTNVNEAPVINDAPNVTLAENSPNGTNVFNVNDANSGADTDVDGNALTYSITAGNAGGAFAINASTGQITVANSALLNFETTPSFALTVQASDGTLSDTAVVTIALTNANEAPVINDVMGLSLAENSANGTVVHNLNDANTGGDTDVDGNALTYSITSGNAAGAFAINPTTGQITVANGALLDFESSPSFALIVQASDGTLMDTAVVTVTLTNVNEPPVINDAPNVTLAENTPNGTLVIDINDAVTGMDRDVENTILIYSIVSGNTGNAFSIGPITGQITVANSSILNLETSPQPFVITVRATDGIQTDDAIITITLTGLNAAPSISDAPNVTLAENSANGTVVHNVNDANTGNDTDTDGDPLTYSITAGNAAGAFAINANTGQITVANSALIDFESSPTFMLTVRASDGSLTDTAVVTVSLTNVNEAPVINNAPNVTLAENSPNGTNVFNVNEATTGGDTDVEGNALTYSITAGNAGGAFAINASTGQITVANSALLNFETTPSFALTVQASDGTLSDTAVVTITLTDVPENISGDFDNDGDVDGADLTVWRAQHGQAGSNLAADDDDNGRVDGTDFLRWQRRIGATSAAAAVAAAVQLEPVADAGSSAVSDGPAAQAEGGADGEAWPENVTLQLSAGESTAGDGDDYVAEGATSAEVVSPQRPAYRPAPALRAWSANSTMTEDEEFAEAADELFADDQELSLALAML